MEYAVPPLVVMGKTSFKSSRCRKTSSDSGWDKAGRGNDSSALDSVRVEGKNARSKSFLDQSHATKSAGGLLGGSL